VRASLGHVRDLPDDELGVDLDHNFKPTYHILRAQSENGSSSCAKPWKARVSFISATDPDREGEASRGTCCKSQPKVPVRR